MHFALKHAPRHKTVDDLTQGVTHHLELFCKVTAMFHCSKCLDNEEVTYLGNYEQPLSMVKLLCKNLSKIPRVDCISLHTYTLTLVRHFVGHIHGISNSSYMI